MWREKWNRREKRFQFRKFEYFGRPAHSLLEGFSWPATVFFRTPFCYLWGVRMGWEQIRMMLCYVQHCRFIKAMYIPLDTNTYRCLVKLSWSRIKLSLSIKNICIIIIIITNSCCRISAFFCEAAWQTCSALFWSCIIYSVYFNYLICSLPLL